MTIYVRQLKENVIRIDTKLKISPFYPIGLIELIKNKVPDENFVLGVCYKSGDSQICISGHPKLNETMAQGASRELKEELSLTTVVDLDIYNNIGNNTFYSLDLKNTTIENTEEFISGYDKKERAVICVHGNEKDILYYLAKLKKYDINEDNIISVWASEKKNILNYLDKDFKSRYMFPKNR